VHVSNIEIGGHGHRCMASACSQEMRLERGGGEDVVMKGCGGNEEGKS
jgi:hypothetical protein